MPEIAIGRKEILKALHVSSWRTIQAWKKQDPGFFKIFRRTPSGKPFIVTTEAIDWLVQYDLIIRRKSRLDK